MQLIEPRDLVADPDNPRAGDPARFELVVLSLRKLGFVLPVYCTAGRMILSGHRRVEAAAHLGWQVPAVLLPEGLRDLMGLNLVFNRATNDFRLTDIDHAGLDADALQARLSELPDAEAPFPCLAPVRRSVPELVALNADTANRYAQNAARALANYLVEMPIVIDPHGRVVNGMGRLQHASDRRLDEIDAVKIDEDQAEAARLALNALSMDFRLSDGFRDQLRANAFRRPRQRRFDMGAGYVFPFQPKRCRDFSLHRNRDRVREVLGASVLDFGAGRGDEARMLRKIGISVTTFEPYRTTGPRPSAGNGRRSARAFLKAVESGRHFDAIMLSSVLNSVPFDADRRHVARICAALADDGSTLYAAARGVQDPNWSEASLGIGLGKTASRSARFTLADEPGMTVSEINYFPKVQRFFQPSELAALFEPLFEDVEIGLFINNVTAVCRRPRATDIAALRTALHFEFDLPYPDGRMGLVDKACEAFSKRLGVSL